MEIKLDPEAVQSIAAKAIFDSLDEDTRTNVVQQAIQGLMVPKKPDQWTRGPGKTPLQEAFDQAIGIAARKAVMDAVEKDPAIQKAIQDLIGPLIQGALSVEAERYDTSLSSKIGEAVGEWLADKAREGY